MKMWVLASILVAASFAGCTDDNNAPVADTLQEAEQAAAELDVEATATTGVIRGVVVDEALRPLGGVLVTLQSMEINATTSDAGAFAFEGLEAGTYFLQATLADYTTVQQSADVVAGVDNPEAIKILLAAIPQATPFVEALQANMFLVFSIRAGVGFSFSWGLINEGALFFEREITPNGTVAQTEFRWEPTSPAAEAMLFRGGTYDGDDRVHYQERAGKAPIIVRSNATTEDGTSDNVYFDAFVDGALGAPVGLAVHQQIDVFIHVFHNFQPNPDWQFGRDGEHPVPGG